MGKITSQILKIQYADQQFAYNAFLLFFFFILSFLFIRFSFSFPLFYDSLAEGLGLIQADEAIGS